MVQEAKRIQQLPPYLFARIEQQIAEARERGVDIISLGIGDPDRPTPPHIIAQAAEQLSNPENHQYPSSVGMLAFRQAVAAYYQRRFKVAVDAKSEVVTLIGSKEGIAHISWCYFDPGDLALVPDPGYPVYGIGSALAGAQQYIMPLRAENGFLPDLKAIPEDVAAKAKLMFLNYPNNPTGAIANLDFYKEVVAFARKYDILVCHDSAYQDLSYDGYLAPSFLEAEGAKEVGIEFGSCSKPYNMTGWRIGWAAGNAKAINALGRLKSNVDSGQFQAVQYAGIAALNGSQDCVRENSRVYQERRDLIIAGLNSMGWNLEAPKSTIYVWAPVPKGFDSMSFAEYVFEKSGVVVTPGNGYGEHGEGFFRISLCIDKERIAEALDRIKKNIGKVEF